MTPERLYPIQIDLTAGERRRLEMVRLLVQMDRPDIGIASWGNCISYLIALAPIPEMLSSRLAGDIQTATHTGVDNGQPIDSSSAGAATRAP